MFLELIFHDNDFGNDASQILAKLWDYIHDNMEQHSPKERTVAEAFVFLHGEGALEPMIKKMMVLSAVGHDVEWATRGLYHLASDCTSHKIAPASNDIDRFEEYFDKIKIAFHDDGMFTIEGEGGYGEHGWLDLDAGNSGIF